jgi:selenide,water dikinase
MAKGGKKKIVLYAGLIPFISRAKEYARMGLIPAGCYTTKSFCEKNVSVDSSIDKVLCDMLFDPQTSGGLVIAFEEMDAQECLKAMGDEGIEASMIGEVLGDHHQGHVSILP